MDPGVLSLVEHPGRDHPITVLSKDIAITAHLADPFSGDLGDGVDSVQSPALQGGQLEVLAAPNDVAAIDVAASAMLGKQGFTVEADWAVGVCRWYGQQQNTQKAQQSRHQSLQTQPAASAQSAAALVLAFF